MSKVLNNWKEGCFGREIHFNKTISLRAGLCSAMQAIHVVGVLCATSYGQLDLIDQIYVSLVLLSPAKVRGKFLLMVIQRVCECV